MVVGLGGLGAPSALELARAGVGELRLLDFDIVDPGTSVRWPFGLQAAGRRKTEVLRDFLREHYPYVKTTIWNRRLGSADIQSGEQPSDLEILDDLFSGADLVYDATADVCVQHLLADLSRERSIPFISVWATEGCWGGMLLRIRPQLTEGCWVCSQHALGDGTIRIAPADSTGNVQPIGCADPTFTGSGFDLATIALSGVRLAVGTIAAGDTAYPDVKWDVARITLRNEDGTVGVPVWEPYTLARHPNCECNR